MHSTRYTALILLLGSLAAPGLFAGGSGSGGSKRNATVTVVNDSSQLVGVTSDANSDAITTAIADLSLTEFTNAGGVLINVGGSVNYSIPAGTYTVGAIDTNFDGLITTTLSIGKGQSLTLYIIDDTSSTATIQFATTSSSGDSLVTTTSGSSDSSSSSTSTAADAITATPDVATPSSSASSATNSTAATAGSTTASPMAVGAGAAGGAGIGLNQMGAGNAAFAAAQQGKNQPPANPAKKKPAPAAKPVKKPVSSDR